MSQFSHGSYALRCRVCEEVTGPEALDACRRCDGPTDVAYDWQHISRTVDPARIAAGPPSLWRYEALLPTAADGGVQAGWTPLERVDVLSELLEIDLLLKLEGSNPTGSYKDRIATIAVGAAREHGMTTLCCSSTGNLGDAVAAAAAATGLEAIVLAPAEVGAGTVAARHPGARVFAVSRHLRRLPPARTGARRALPVGLRQRQPAPLRERGCEDDLVRDRGAARVATP